jgi:hypothetical protein
MTSSLNVGAVAGGHSDFFEELLRDYYGENLSCYSRASLESTSGGQHLANSTEESGSPVERISPRPSTSQQLTRKQKKNRQRLLREKAKRKHRADLGYLANGGGRDLGTFFRQARHFAHQLKLAPGRLRKCEEDSNLALKEGRISDQQFAKSELHFRKKQMEEHKKLFIMQIILFLKLKTINKII